MYPCKNCTDRTLACHGTCEKYKAVKEKADEARAERYLVGGIAEMNMASMRRNRRKRYDRKWH